jgi:hypothetical protein
MSSEKANLLIWYEARVPSIRLSRNMFIRFGPLLDTEDDFVIAANKFLGECRELLKEGEQVYDKAIVVALGSLRTCDRHLADIYSAGSRNYSAEPPGGTANRPDERLERLLLSDIKRKQGFQKEAADAMKNLVKGESLTIFAVRVGMPGGPRLPGAADIDGTNLPTASEEISVFLIREKAIAHAEGLIPGEPKFRSDVTSLNEKLGTYYHYYKIDSEEVPGGRQRWVTVTRLEVTREKRTRWNGEEF